MTIKATLDGGEEQPAARQTYNVPPHGCPACGRTGCGGDCGSSPAWTVGAMMSAPPLPVWDDKAKNERAFLRRLASNRQD